MIARLAATYPNDVYNDPASWPRCAPLTPHLLASCETETADAATSAKCADLLDRAGSIFMVAPPIRWRGRYTNARWRCAKGARSRAFRNGNEPQQSRRPAADQGDLAGARPLLERALAIAGKRSDPNIAIRRPDSTTSPACLRTRATLPARGRSTNAHWRSARRCSVPSILIRREPQQPRRPASGPGRS